jgi:hypothetical protein
MDNLCIVGIIFWALLVGAIDLGWYALRKYMKKKDSRRSGDNPKRLLFVPSWIGGEAIPIPGDTK